MSQITVRTRVHIDHHDKSFLKADRFQDSSIFFFRFSFFNFTLFTQSSQFSLQNCFDFCKWGMTSQGGKFEFQCIQNSRELQNSTISNLTDNCFDFQKHHNCHDFFQPIKINELFCLARIWQNRPVKTEIYRWSCDYNLANSLISKWGDYLRYHNST